MEDDMAATVGRIENDQRQLLRNYQRFHPTVIEAMAIVTHVADALALRKSRGLSLDKVDARDLQEAIWNRARPSHLPWTEEEPEVPLHELQEYWERLAYGEVFSNVQRSVWERRVRDRAGATPTPTPATTPAKRAAKREPSPARPPKRTKDGGETDDAGGA